MNTMIKKIHAFRERLRNNEGYSLIEIMVVMVIIGGLIAGTVTLINKAMSRKDVTNAKTMVKQRIIMELENYKADNGQYPSTEDGLQALVEAKQLKSKEIIDPWGRPYEYISPGEKTNKPYEVWSYGADGKEGGKGADMDITSWDPEDEENN